MRSPLLPKPPGRPTNRAAMGPNLPMRAFSRLAAKPNIYPVPPPGVKGGGEEEKRSQADARNQDQKA